MKHSTLCGIPEQQLELPSNFVKSIIPPKQKQHPSFESRNTGDLTKEKARAGRCHGSKVYTHPSLMLQHISPLRVLCVCNEGLK